MFEDVFEPRPRADLWASAYVRMCRAEGAAAYVIQKGDPTAGIILIRINALDGTSLVLSPARGIDGTRIWLPASKEGFCPDSDCEDYLSRARSRDPDLWIIEVEDRARRHFLTEPVEGL